jgi:hypothetical protein
VQFTVGLTIESRQGKDAVRPGTVKLLCDLIQGHLTDEMEANYDPPPEPYGEVIINAPDMEAASTTLDAACEAPSLRREWFEFRPET